MNLVLLEIDAETHVLSISENSPVCRIDRYNTEVDLVLPEELEGATVRLNFELPVQSRDGCMFHPFVYLSGVPYTFPPALLLAADNQIIPIRAVITTFDEETATRRTFASVNSVSLEVARALQMEIDDPGWMIDVGLEDVLLDVNLEGKHLLFTQYDTDITDIDLTQILRDGQLSYEVEQDLTEAEQDRARDNIDAVGRAEYEGHVGDYDALQASMTDYVTKQQSFSDKVIVTDAQGQVSEGPAIVTSRSEEVSDGNLPTEKLMYHELGLKADDALVVHNDYGTPDWDATINYRAGATVMYNLQLYISQNPDNLNHVPDAEGSVWWSMVMGIGGGDDDTPGAYRTFILGNGEHTVFNLAHGFNSFNVAHVMYSNSGADAKATFTRTDKNHVTVKFAVAPATDEYTVVVYRPGLGPETVVTSINGTQGDVVLGNVVTRDTGTAAGNVPVLNSKGKLADSVIPPLAIGEVVGKVDERSDLVTLNNAQEGDIAVVEDDGDIDNNGVYWLNGDYSNLSDWVQIVGPGAVISVNGHSGIVTLDYTDVGAVPASRTVNNKVLSADITLGPSDVGAVPTTRMVNGKALSADVSLDYTDVGAVPDTRKVNEKTLSSDVTLDASDVGAVPDTRKVNNKALSQDISLDYVDVGAVPTTRMVNGKALDDDVELDYTDVGAVPDTRKVNEKTLSSDVTLDASDVGAVPDTRKVNNKALSQDISLDYVDVGAVPTTRMVNGKALDDDVELDYTDVGAVPDTRKVNNKALSSDVTLNASDVGAVPTVRKINDKALSADVSLDYSDVGAVPDTRKVNDKTLSSDVTLSASDVGAVPDTRKVNNKTLSSDVTLNASDVGAVPTVRKINDKALSADVSLDYSDVGAVPDTRKVNDKTLSSDVTLSASDVGAVPDTRKVNNKTLSSDVTLDASDVGAVPDTRKVNDKTLSSDVTLDASDVGAVPDTRKVNSKVLSADVTLGASDVGAVPVTRKISGNALSQDINLVAADITDGVVTSINGTQGDVVLGNVVTRDTGTAAGNVPVLNSKGKLPDSVIPPLAIGEVVGKVDERSDLVTLNNAQEGDIAVVEDDGDIDNNGVYWLNGDYSNLSDWVQIVGPGAVISVNGHSGIVTLDYTDVGAVPASRTVNNKVLSADITLGPSDVGAVPTTRMVNGKALSADVSLDYTDVGAVPDTRKVNNKALSQDISLDYVDVGAVPTTRKINSKVLSADVSLDYSDVGAVPDTRKVNGKALDDDVTLSASDVGAVPDTRKVNDKALSSDVTLDASDVGAVPTTRKINSKVLSADVTLGASDVGAVPTTRTVNSNPLSADIVLGASDVGAVPVTRKISGNALSQDINLVAADITDGILDIARLPTGNAADKVPKLSAAATEGQSLRARSDGTFEPFTPSTSSMAMYTGNITGDGSTKVFPLNHGLTGTPMVTLTDGNGRTVHTTTVTDASTVTVTFHTAPAQGIKYTVRAIA